MTNNKIIEALKESNKWWKGKFRLEYKPREIYSEIKRFISTKQILAFTGLRRVGKTTLMLKIVQDKIDSGFDPEDIVYFSFDNLRDVEVQEVIRSYMKLMDKDEDKGKYLFLFDEIQKVGEWEEQIKRIYDHHSNFKIIISGSESLFIRKGTRESLAGRFFEFKVHQLSFKEFLGFKGQEFKNIKLYKEELLKEFERYLWGNGFPELIGSNKEVIKKYLKENILEKIIYRDIPQIFPAKETAILENIFNIILFDPGEIINLNSLAEELGISRQTASTYLNYLEKSFLVKKVYNFSRNVRKTERRLKKYYPTIVSPQLIERGERGKILETVMVLQLGADFFWRDAYKNEVDIVLVDDKKIIPVEVKSGKIEVKPLLHFMEKFKVKEGLVISLEQEKEIERKGRKIKVIPAYKFLLQKTSQTR